MLTERTEEDKQIHLHDVKLNLDSESGAGDFVNISLPDMTDRDDGKQSIGGIGFNGMNNYSQRQPYRARRRASFETATGKALQLKKDLSYAT